jgi:hypothetical protein
LKEKTDELQTGVQPPGTERGTDHEKPAPSASSKDRVFVADTIGQCVNSGLKLKTAAQMLGVTVRQV